VILVRHGRTTANTSGVLAGRTRGVRLDETGVGQAQKTAERLAVVPLVAVVTSPLERCRQTARAILKAQEGSPVTATERGITECDYGAWQGRPLKELAKDPLWKVVQTQPSAAAFPDGESMAAMQARSVNAVRRLDAQFEAEHGPGAVWVAVSHGDIIKSVLADALEAHGIHCDVIVDKNLAEKAVLKLRRSSAEIPLPTRVRRLCHDHSHPGERLRAQRWTLAGLLRSVSP